MADVVDMAVDIEAEHVARGLARARLPIAAGWPGECDNCGEDMPRLVNGLCGFCRDGRIPNLRRAAAEATPIEEVETVMPAKSIQLPASATGAIAAVERHAAKSDLSYGAAAASLITAGAQALAAPEPAVAPLSLADVHLDALLDEVRLRFERAAQPEALDAAVARAEAAEAKLAQFKALLA